MEVYGVKPKRFTKEWWEYFWDYYKWHTIGVILAVIVIISSAVDCAKQIKYDLQVDFITEKGILPEQQEALTNIITEHIDDITENGKKEAYLTYLDMRETADPQMMQAIQTKFMVEAGYSEGYVFIVTKKYADYFKDGGIFLEASAWTDKESYDGCFVSVKDSKSLLDIGIDTEDLYVAVLVPRSDNKKKDKLCNEKQENGIKIAQYLINQR